MDLKRRGALPLLRRGAAALRTLELGQPLARASPERFVSAPSRESRDRCAGKGAGSPLWVPGVGGKVPGSSALRKVRPWNRCGVERLCSLLEDPRAEEL